MDFKQESDLIYISKKFLCLGVAAPWRQGASRQVSRSETRRPGLVGPCQQWDLEGQMPRLWSCGQGVRL